MRASSLFMAIILFNAYGCRSSAFVTPDCRPAYDECVSRCAPKCEPVGSDLGNEAMSANRLNPDQVGQTVRVECYQCANRCKVRAAECGEKSKKSARLD